MYRAATRQTFIALTVMSAAWWWAGCGGGSSGGPVDDTVSVDVLSDQIGSDVALDSVAVDTGGAGDVGPDVAADAVDDSVAPADADAGVDGVGDVAGDGDSGTDVEDAGPDAVDVAVDTGPEVVTPPPIDCDNLPAGPFSLTKLVGPIASEDLAFDAVGNVVGSNDNAIFKTPYGGSPQLFVPNLDFRAGMRFLPNGHLIFCDDVRGEVSRIDPTGVKQPVMTGLSYPNGLAVDLAGYVYFTEHDADVVWRLHPYTGAATVMTDRIESPNGLAFSPDYTTLYIGGFNGDPGVYAMNISPDGVPGKLVRWAEVGTGWHDGIAVDACGNVYLADYSATFIYRITPDGQTADVIIDGTGFENAYLPNMQWGSGLGGWSETSIFLPDGWNKGVFEVDIGVPGAPRAFP